MSGDRVEVELREFGASKLGQVINLCRATLTVWSRDSRPTLEASCLRVTAAETAAV